MQVAIAGIKQIDKNNCIVHAQRTMSRKTQGEYIYMRVWQKFIFLLACLSSSNDLLACSRIFWNSHAYKLTARTMDLYVDEEPLISVSPPGIQRRGHKGKNPLIWTSKYGSLVVTAFHSDTVSEGFNEKGFAAHVLYLDATKYAPKDQRQKLSNGLWVQFLVDNFSTVQEALSFCDRYRIISIPLGGEKRPLHACIEDASGDSAIIEYIDGLRCIYHGPQHAVLTNDPIYLEQLKQKSKYKSFGGLLPLPTDLHSKGRFIRASALLQTLPASSSLDAATRALINLAKTIQIPFKPDMRTGPKPWPTRWVAISDLTHKVYYFYSTSALRWIWIDLKKINFFSFHPVRQINPHDRLLCGEIQFTPLYSPFHIP